jgi:N-acetylmuramoyl-L-alanine amidase
MSRPLAVLLLFLLPAAPVLAAVEIAVGKQPAATIREVYLRGGVPYLALDEVLAAAGLKADWDPVAHRCRIKSPAGIASLAPGSRTLRLDGSTRRLAHPPLFIDGRLRVAEEFVTTQLADLAGQSVRYRNLDPPQPADQGKESSPLDRLFDLLLAKEPPAVGPALRVLVIDPGHGGVDPGALGADGTKEKEVTLAVAQRLEKLVKMQMGSPVFLTRDGDYAATAEQRRAAFARPEIDVLLLLHAQAAPAATPHGAVLFVAPPAAGAAAGGESRRLAGHLRAALLAAGVEAAGILEAPLLPLAEMGKPAVLIELGYLTNPDDLALLSDPPGQERLAAALFAGLKSYAEEPKEVHR